MECLMFWLNQFINNLLCKLQIYQWPNGQMEINFTIIDFHSETNSMIQIAIGRQQKMKCILFESGGIISFRRAESLYKYMIVIRNNMDCETEQVKLSDGEMEFCFEHTKKTLTTTKLIIRNRHMNCSSFPSLSLPLDRDRPG